MSLSVSRNHPAGARRARPVIAGNWPFRAMFSSAQHRSVQIDIIALVRLIRQEWWFQVSVDEEPSRLDVAVALFHSLSDANRLAIVRRLAAGEARVVDLVGQLGLAQSTVSAHIACLRGCGLVAGRPQGRQVFYSLVRPELLDLLAAAETLLEATGSVVALCPNYGTTTLDEGGDAGVVETGVRF